MLRGYNVGTMRENSLVPNDILDEIFVDGIDLSTEEFFLTLVEQEKMPNVDNWCYEYNNKLFEFKESFVRNDLLERMFLLHFVKIKKDIELLELLIRDYVSIFKKFYIFDNYDFRLKTIDNYRKDIKEYNLLFRTFGYTFNNTLLKCQPKQIFEKISTSYSNNKNYFSDIENRKKCSSNKFMKLFKNQLTNQYVNDFDEVWDLAIQYKNYMEGIHELQKKHSMQIYEFFVYNVKTKTFSLCYELVFPQDIFFKFDGLIHSEYLKFKS